MRTWPAQPDDWLDQVRQCHAQLPDSIRDTPLSRVPWLDDRLGAEVFLKNECLGPIRSFKARGTEALFDRRRPTGTVACASAGNFGQGVAWSASRRGLRTVVFAATGASPLKVERMRRLGADVRQAGRDLDEAKEIGKAEAERAGWTFLEDGREEELFVGTATIGLEVEAALPFDLLLCPVGNGALFGGLSGWAALRELPARRVGVTAAKAPSMALSFAAGGCVSTPSAETIADGIAIREPVPQGVERVNAFADDVVVVSEEALLEAVRVLSKTTEQVIEPAGAAGVAALLEFPSRWLGQRIVIPLCGANLDPDRCPD